MEGGFRQARAFGRRHMNISLSLRNKQQKQSDNTRDVTSKRIKFKVNDRVGDAYDWRAEVEQILDRDRVTASDATSTLYDLGLGYRRRLSSGWDIRGDFNLGRQETGTLNATGTDIANRWRVGLNADRGNGTVLGINLERNSADLVALNADNVHTRSSVYWQTKPAWLKDGSSKLEYADFIHAFTENAANDYREQVLKIILQWNL